VNVPGTEGLSERTRENQRQFDRVAEDFYSKPLSFFETLGAGLVNAVGVRPDDHVLDLACGAGALTLPAARLVGRRGRVLGVDISRAMTEVTARRSRNEGLDWVAVRQAAIERLELGERFDLALCGFAVHHFDDPATVPRTIARHLKPRGRWGLSLWAERSWEPHRPVFNRVVSKVRPDLATGPGGSARLQERGAIEAIAREAGLRVGSVRPQRLEHVLEDFDSYWHLVMTSGGRSVLSKLSPEEQLAVCDELRVAIGPYCDHGGRLTLSMDAVYVIGTS
jgi:ubiquinone/menaquinone biosynthesis C-methylase UbiE